LPQEQNLVAAIPNISILPVIKFARAMLNDADKEKAEKEKIGILTLDNFEGLPQLAIEGGDSNKVRDFSLRLVFELLTEKSILSCLFLQDCA
jgi:hypothetical protein